MKQWKNTFGNLFVIASLIYVWGNQWVVNNYTKQNNYIIAIKYNRITGETKFAMPDDGWGWKLIPDN
jgi:hypothetical protein